MEAIVTVEYRFSYGYKYTSHYKGMEVAVVPAFGSPLKYAGFTDREGVITTFMKQCNETDIVTSLIKAKCNPLLMKWCMEESREYGFNPFVVNASRLLDYPPHVYIAHDLDDDLIKVGTSGNYKNRMNQLYSLKGHTFKLLGLIQGQFHVERAVCKRFKEHLAFGREWFRPHQDILDFVTEYTFNPGAPVEL